MRNFQLRSMRTPKGSPFILCYEDTRLVIDTSRTDGSAKKFVRITSGFGGGKKVKKEKSKKVKKQISIFDMYIPCEASSWTLLHQNRKLSSRISLQNRLFCLCRLPAVRYVHGVMKICPCTGVTRSKQYTPISLLNYIL